MIAIKDYATLPRVALRTLVQAILAAEQGFVDPTLIERFATERSALPLEVLLAAVERQRLVSFLHGQPLVQQLAPDLDGALLMPGRLEVLAALALTSLSRTLAARFEAAAIPVLLIKGVPLALQTTGSPLARGRGDLDLLVEPAQVPAALALLKSEGFRRVPGEMPFNLQSFWGRYGRWVGYEITLVRQRGSGRDWVDLHWALSNIRGPLPSFAEAWARRELLLLQGQSLPTLHRRDAFAHACAHASKDGWMCWRNLIDIDRLARQLPPWPVESRPAPRLVRMGAAATFALTQGEHLLAWTGPPCRSASWAVARAAQAQARPWRREGTGPWTPAHTLRPMIRMLILSMDPQDWLRILLRFLLAPATFNDPISGRDRGLLGASFERGRRLLQRLAEGRR